MTSDTTTAIGHREIDHTADLAIEIWAPSESELLEEAARAVVAIMTEGAEVTAGAQRRVALETVDAEDRLVQWINEIIYLAVTDGFLVAETSLDVQTGGLTATLDGEAGAAGRIAGELKSATYHDLALEQRESGWWARVVIDV